MVVSGKTFLRDAGCWRAASVVTGSTIRPDRLREQANAAESLPGELRGVWRGSHGARARGPAFIAAGAAQTGDCSASFNAMPTDSRVAPSRYPREHRRVHPASNGRTHGTQPLTRNVVVIGAPARLRRPGQRTADRGERRRSRGRCGCARRSVGAARPGLTLTER